MVHLLARGLAQRVAMANVLLDPPPVTWDQLSQDTMQDLQDLERHGYAVAWPAQRLRERQLELPQAARSEERQRGNPYRAGSIEAAEWELEQGR